MICCLLLFFFYENYLKMFIYGLGYKLLLKIWVVDVSFLYWCMCILDKWVICFSLSRLFVNYELFNLEVYYDECF